jgi:hypothetical protein
MSVKRRLCQHLQSSGFSSKNSSRFASLIDKWITQSGKQWTTDRLKDLKKSLRLSVQTGEYRIPQGWATVKNRSGKVIFKDSVVHSIMNAKSNLEIERALSFVNCYTVIYESRVTKKQIDKFNLAVLGGENPRKEDQAYKRLLDVVASCTKVICKDKSRFSGKSRPLVYFPQSTKTSPVLILEEYSEPDGLSSISIKSESRKNIATKSLTLLEVDQKWNKHWNMYPEQVRDTILGDTKSALFPVSYPFWLERPVEFPIGSIGYIQEGGCKLRAVASPLLVVQALSEPLKDKLSKLISQFSQIAVFDQDSGRNLVKTWLDANKSLLAENKQSVYCYDCSSFTDRLPYEIQDRILQSLKSIGYINQFDIDTMRLASKSGYHSSEHDELVHWVEGQPQGLGPSFFLATLTHFMVLRSLSFNHQVEKFSIIGDDVVIYDDKLASDYESAMDLLGVDINMDKSIISPTLAEYAGKLITSDGIIPSSKVKDIKNTDQLIKLIDFYGINGWNALPREQFNAALKAILPPDFGGIGFDIGLSEHSQNKRVKGVNGEKILVKRLKNFFKEVYEPTPSSETYNTLNWISSFYNLIDLRMSHTELISYLQLIGGVELSSVKVSEWSGLIHLATEHLDIKPNADLIPLLDSSVLYEYFSRGCNNSVSQYKTPVTSNSSLDSLMIKSGLPVDFSKKLAEFGLKDISAVADYLQDIVGKIPSEELTLVKSRLIKNQGNQNEDTNHNPKGGPDSGNKFNLGHLNYIDFN